MSFPGGDTKIARMNAASPSELINLAAVSDFDERLSLLEAELQKKEQTRNKRTTATQRIDKLEDRLARLESAMGQMQEAFGDFIAALNEDEEDTMHEEDEP